MPKTITTKNIDGFALSTIELSCSRDGEPDIEYRPALQFGPLAITPNLSDEYYYTITHVRTGYAVFPDKIKLELSQAIRLVVALDRLNIPWDGDTKEDVIAHLTQEQCNTIKQLVIRFRDEESPY